MDGRRVERGAHRGGMGGQPVCRGAVPMNRERAGVPLKTLSANGYVKRLTFYRRSETISPARDRYFSRSSAALVAPDLRQPCLVTTH